MWSLVDVQDLQVLKAFRAMPMKGPDGRVSADQPPTHLPPRSQQQPAAKARSAAPSPGAGGGAAAAAAEARSTTPPASAQGGGAPKPLASITAAAHKAEHPPAMQYTESGSQIPIGNGGVGPEGSYVWTQTLQDCTVHIPVPPSCTGKRVQAAFKPTSVQLHVRDVPAASLEGELGGDVVPDECLFTLDRDASSCTLTVTFEKRTETWWRSVLKGHPEIDASMVDSTRHVSEYDDETQATIRKLVVS